MYVVLTFEFIRRERVRTGELGHVTTFLPITWRFARPVDAYCYSYFLQFSTSFNIFRIKSKDIARFHS